MIKYYVRTLYRLPPSKWILDDLARIPSILNAILAKKPANRKISEESMLDSIAVIEFDTDKLINWKDVFREFTDWDWIDLEGKK